MKTSLKNQNGASLMVSMVILILVSLIGVTALKNASIEEKMAANLHQKNLTFQASESAVENTVFDSNTISTAMNSAGAVTTTINDITPNTSAEVEYMYLGNAPVLNYSQGVFAGARIMITSTATSDDTRTRTVHGVVRLVPDLSNE